MSISLRIKEAAAGIRGLYALNIRKNPGNFFPPYLNVKLTDRCNYLCVTCGHHKMEDAESELTPEELRLVVRDFKRSGGLSVRFTGGEPFLREDICPLISYTKSLGLRLVIATNGSLLTEEHIRLFKRECVDSISVSMDGRRETHDDIVGLKGSWEQVDDIVRRMRNLDLPVVIAFTITSRNIGEIEYIVEYAAGLGTAVRFNICDSNVYFFRGIERSVIPDVEEMQEAAEILIEQKREHPGNVIGGVKAFKEIPGLVRDRRMPYYYCARTLMRLYVDGSGNVYPGCWVMPPVGNLRDDTLRGIFYSRSYKEGRLRGFNKKCPGCTCGYAQDIMMNMRKRRTRSGRLSQV